MQDVYLFSGTNVAKEIENAKELNEQYHEKAGYPVYLITYLSAVSLATYLVYLLETSIYRWAEKRKEKKLETN